MLGLRQAIRFLVLSHRFRPRGQYVSDQLASLNAAKLLWRHDAQPARVSEGAIQLVSKSQSVFITLSRWLPTEPIIPALSAAHVKLLLFRSRMLVCTTVAMTASPMSELPI